MKRIFTLLLACTFAFSLSAQMPDGTVVPDFTTTDLNGNTFNLYEQLDAGKTVIVDVFAVWCGPCWSYHQTHALEDIYCRFGEDEDVVVIGIEGDSSTPASTISGGGSSIGDWTDGVSYHVADDASVASLLEISYYPTVYKICPTDKTIYEVGAMAAAAATAQIFDTSCKTANVANDVQNIDCHSAAPSCQLKTEIINRGANTANNVVVTALDAQGNELASTTIDEVASFEVVDVIVGSDSFDQDEDVTFTVSYPEDEVASNNSVVRTIQPVPSVTDNYLTFELITDDYGPETYWEFRNGNGEVLASGGNEDVGPNGGGIGEIAGGPGAYGNGETIVVDIVAPMSDCYELLVVDAFGDGICCSYGNGSYKLSDSQGNVIFSGGSFAAYQSENFLADVGVSTNEAPVANSMKVFPNPVADQMTVEFDLEETENIEITVYNALGQEVRSLGQTTYTAGTQIVNINAADFETGMYLVTLRGADFATSRKFTVSK